MLGAIGLLIHLRLLRLRVGILLLLGMHLAIWLRILLLASVQVLMLLLLVTGLLLLLCGESSSSPLHWHLLLWIAATAHW